MFFRTIEINNQITFGMVFPSMNSPFVACLSPAEGIVNLLRSLANLLPQAGVSRSKEESPMGWFSVVGFSWTISFRIVPMIFHHFYEIYQLVGGEWLPWILFSQLGWSHHPNWRTLIFFRGVAKKPPTSIKHQLRWSLASPIGKTMMNPSGKMIPVDCRETIGFRSESCSL